MENTGHQYDVQWNIMIICKINVFILMLAMTSGKRLDTNAP